MDSVTNVRTHTVVVTRPRALTLANETAAEGLLRHYKKRVRVRATLFLCTSSARVKAHILILRVIIIIRTYGRYTRRFWRPPRAPGDIKTLYGHETLL